MTLTRLDSADDEPRWELGATGHGPLGNILATRICDQIREWGHDRSVEPTVIATHTGPTNDLAPDSLPIIKPCARLVVAY